MIFLNPDDITERGFTDGQLVDIETHWPGDDVVRSVKEFRIVGYDTPRGSAAAYYPETSPLIPLDSTALESNTPTSKSVIVTTGAGRSGPRTAGRRREPERGRVGLGAQMGTAGGGAPVLTTDAGCQWLLK